MDDVDQVGVCLKSCLDIDSYDVQFYGTGYDGDGDEVVSTPYEISPIDGRVELEFLLPTLPLSDVKLNFEAVLPGGIVELHTAEDTPTGQLSPPATRRLRQGAPEASLTFTSFTWNSRQTLVLRAAVGADVRTERQILVTAMLASGDSFYDDRRFRFMVYIRPPMAGPEACVEVGVEGSATVVSSDGVAVELPELALMPGTTACITPLPPSEITCGYNYGLSSRVVPFGFKDINFDAPMLTEVLDPPGRVYWRISKRWSSLEQVKFVTASTKGDFRPVCATPICCFMMPVDGPSISSVRLPHGCLAFAFFRLLHQPSIGILPSTCGHVVAAFSPLSPRQSETWLCFPECRNGMSGIGWLMNAVAFPLPCPVDPQTHVTGN